MIRDYGQAASDLQRLISILEKQSNTKSQSGSLDNTKELRQAQRQLSSMLEEAKRGIPLDLYLILGVKPSDSASDVKKAYRKAALRHHPDKAGQFLARSESGDEGRLWKEIAEEVHKDADRLFKMIGEAYAVLSDTAKHIPPIMLLSGLQLQSTTGGQSMILKRKSEKLPRKAKAAHMKDHGMSMDILMRGVQTDDIGGRIGRPIKIFILDGRRPREGFTLKSFCP
ncbi:hypothetical protein COLO4_36515 [Corchorus olitorius]|uniref:J domain-containing protein n=1 Tax=Corchorus olitorius TaxID=93759 RepID=A0A1R3G8E8_9ROSI|nr:hypothetical protein COLO4_36515 [Corchorus olitorius]